MANYSTSSSLNPPSTMNDSLFSPLSSSSASSSSSSLPEESPLPSILSSSRPPKELKAEKGKQKGEIRGIERYRIMKLVLKGDFPAGNCVETPKRHLAGQKYWKKEVQVPEEVLANAGYYLDLQVLAPKGQLIEQCQKCRQESGRNSFVLVCCEGTRSTEEGLCIPLICPCLPTHQNKQATFDLRVNIVNKITREIEYYSMLPISFRTGKKKRSDSPSPSPSPSSTRSSSPPPKVPKHKKSSSASSLGYPQQRKDSSIVISPHPKESQLFSSSSFSSAASANWFANTASSIEFHWNSQPSQFLRQQQQQLAQFNSQLAANGLLYQQEYETPLGQMTFKTPPTGPSTAPPTASNMNPNIAKPSSFFYEASTDYWLTDWLNEAFAEGGRPHSHFHHSNVAPGEREGSNASSSSTSSHQDSNESGSGGHSHPPHSHPHPHPHAHPRSHRIPIKGHIEGAHSYPYFGANNQPIEFEELFPVPPLAATGFNNFLTSAGSVTAPFYGQSY